MGLHSIRKLILPSPVVISCKLILSYRWNLISPFPNHAGILADLICASLVHAVTADVNSQAHSPAMPSKQCFSADVLYRWLLPSGCPLFHDDP